MQLKKRKSITQIAEELEEEEAVIADIIENQHFMPF